MLLRTTVNSPFGRKVRVAATWLGLDDRITLADTDYLDAADPLRVENPLGKMPVLTLDDGTTLFDSRVIVAYLDAMGGGRLVPAIGPDRWPVLRLQALADGIADAGVLIVMERRHRAAPMQDPAWIAYQQDKMRRGFADLAEALPAPGRIDAGTIALACLLEWVEFRKPVMWREEYPAFVGWLAAFHRAMPFFVDSAPVVA